MPGIGCAFRTNRLAGALARVRKGGLYRGRRDVLHYIGAVMFDDAAQCGRGPKVLGNILIDQKAVLLRSHEPLRERNRARPAGRQDGEFQEPFSLPRRAIPPRTREHQRTERRVMTDPPDL